MFVHNYSSFDLTGLWASFQTFHLRDGKTFFRWFDKCFQLVVDAQGITAINFEHSWGDGVAILRLMEESFRDTKQNHFVNSNQTFSATKHLKNHLHPIG